MFGFSAWGGFTALTALDGDASHTVGQTAGLIAGVMFSLAGCSGGAGLVKIGYQQAKRDCSSDDASSGAGDMANVVV